MTYGVDERRGMTYVVDERRGMTYIVDEPVKNLLNQALLGYELCLSINLSLHLLQVPVDQLALPQRALLIHCQADTQVFLC